MFLRLSARAAGWLKPAGVCQVLYSQLCMKSGGVSPHLLLPLGIWAKQTQTWLARKRSMETEGPGWGDFFFLLPSSQSFKYLRQCISDLGSPGTQRWPQHPLGAATHEDRLWTLGAAAGAQSWKGSTPLHLSPTGSTCLSLPDSLVASA